MFRPASGAPSRVKKLLPGAANGREASRVAARKKLATGSVGQLATAEAKRASAETILLDASKARPWLINCGHVCAPVDAARHKKTMRDDNADFILKFVTLVVGLQKRSADCGRT